MRVIGGRFKKRKLAHLGAKGIRPTGDRCREAIFNILGPRTQGATVLDLFAGTGALGIEAVSRGAVSADFIDHASEALMVIRRNVGLCGIESQTRILSWDIRKNLNCIASPLPLYSLVFMDPPYGKHLIAPALTHLLEAGCLKHGARVVVEHAAEESVSQIDVAPHPVHGYRSVFTLLDQRRYGKTLVSFLAYML